MERFRGQLGEVLGNRECICYSYYYIIKLYAFRRENYIVMILQVPEARLGAPEKGKEDSKNLLH